MNRIFKTLASLLIVVFSTGCLVNTEIEGTTSNSTEPINNEPPTSIPTELKVDLTSPTSSQNINEGQNLFFVFVFSESAELDADFEWSLSGGASDFALTSGVVSISKGDNSVTVPLDVIDDNIYEPGLESFTLTVDSPLANDPATIELNLSDDESPPTFTATTGTYYNEDHGSDQINLFLSHPSTERIVMDFSVNVGSVAVEISDYTIDTSDTFVEFLPGETSKSIPISIVDDSDVEGAPEYFRFDYSSNVLSGDVTISSYYSYQYITDNDTATIYAFFESTANINVIESAVSTSVTFKLSQVSASDVDIDYFVSGSATNPEDHTLTSPDTITITAGNLTETLLVPIVDDSIPESINNISINRSTVTGATWTGGTSAQVYITDDDNEPSISMNVDTVALIEGTDTTIEAHFTLSGPFGDSLNVYYSIEEQGMSSYHDYSGSGSYVTVPAGTTTFSVTKTLEDDNRHEPLESLVIGLTDNNGYSLGALTNTTFTVTDDDPTPPTLNLRPVTQVEGCAALFYAELSLETGYPVSFDFATADGSAIAGLDYIARSGTYTIPKDRKGIGIMVDLLDDGGGDADETFDMTISNVSIASIGTATETATIKEAFPDFSTPVRLLNTPTTVGEFGGTLDDNGCFMTIAMNYDADPAYVYQLYYLDFFASNVIPITDEGDYNYFHYQSSFYPNRLVRSIGSPGFNMTDIESMNIDGSDLKSLMPSGMGSGGALKISDNG